MHIPVVSAHPIDGSNDLASAGWAVDPDENGKMGGKKGTFEARQTVIMSDIVHRFSRELTLLFASQDASSERCKSTATALFNLL